MQLLGGKDPVSMLGFLRSTVIFTIVSDSHIYQRKNELVFENRITSVPTSLFMQTYPKSILSRTNG